MPASQMSEWSYIPTPSSTHGQGPGAHVSLLDAQTSSHTKCQLKFTCSQASLEPIRGLLGPIESTLPTLGLSHFPEVAPQANACTGTRSRPPGPRGVLPPPTLVSTPFPGMCYVWGLYSAHPLKEGPWHVSQ